MDNSELEMEDATIAEGEAPYSVKSFRDLRVWQEAMLLAEDVYKSLMNMPCSELYNLRSQMQRAVVSIPSNIAEGHARNSTKDYLRFISIAQGSTAELETQLVLSNRLGFLHDEPFHKLLERTTRIRKQLHSLEAALKRRLQPQPLTPNP